jgi:RNA polymerase sigma factor (sigma-70 family)
MTMHHHSRPYITAVDDERARSLSRAVKAAAAGDDSAWAAIVQQFATRVRYAARKRSLAGHDIEDVEQETWLSLLKNIESIRDPAALGAWLETTATHASLDTVRRNGRERPTDDELLSDTPVDAVAEERLVAAERSHAVTKAIGRLPSHQRELLAMLVLDPTASYADISRLLTIPVGSIGPTRGRALARLREDDELARVVNS